MWSFGGNIKTFQMWNLFDLEEHTVGEAGRTVSSHNPGSHPVSNTRKNDKLISSVVERPQCAENHTHSVGHVCVCVCALISHYVFIPGGCLGERTPPRGHISVYVKCSSRSSVRFDIREDPQQQVRVTTAPGAAVLCSAARIREQEGPLRCSLSPRSSSGPPRSTMR